MADIVADRVNPAETFHYVVQRRGDSDILGWGQETTMAAAIDTSEMIMRELGGRRLNEAVALYDAVMRRLDRAAGFSDQRGIVPALPPVRL